MNDIGDLLSGYPHDYVVCRECGKKFKTIEWSHLHHKHNMDIDEYERKYPNSPRVCTKTLLRLGRFKEVKDRIT